MSKTIKLQQNHFDMKKFTHNTTNSIVVEIYHYNSVDVDFVDDISDMIVDYSYDCTSTDNIHMTASLTLNADIFETRQKLKRENKINTWYDEVSTSVMSVGYMHYCFHLVKTYTDNDTNVTNQIDLGYFIATDYSFNYSATTNEISISLSGLSVLLTKEYGGTVFTFRKSAEIDYINPITQKTEKRIMTLPTTISIDKDTPINGTMLYDLAKGSNRKSDELQYLNSTTAIPIKWAITGDGQRLNYLAEDMDFDADISRADELQEVMDYAFVDGTFWVDEDRVLNMSSRPPKRGYAEMLWKHYGQLFLTENSSYNDSDYYNVTEVYGKDNEYYAVYEDCDLNEVYQYTRKQIITDDTLLSNEECYDRAVWETYKSMSGHQTWTVTLADGYIPQFDKPSKIVGKRVEYTTVDGDTNLYLLNKLSYSSNTWTMELTLFKPIYEEDIKSFDDRLRVPKIYAHEIIDNKYIRLYVTGEDIEYGLIKLYYNTWGALKAQSCNIADNGINKYIDVEITDNGVYSFYASLYSPYYYDSGLNLGHPYQVTVNIPNAERKDTDPYPHPPMYDDEGGHLPYLLNSQLQVLTDNEGNYLTT